VDEGVAFRIWTKPISKSSLYSGSFSLFFERRKSLVNSPSLKAPYISLNMDGIRRFSGRNRTIIGAVKREKHGDGDDASSSLSGDRSG
jgi:hypothetical protein